ncbi:MAG TPA: mucin desulfatase [Lachnospiraceae bacterium]|nr:mucin desulfatase [Lachnospiraceae bacterium]HCA69040.1 mucin desulfatase [Lachnospiraceae bacterium]
MTREEYCTKINEAIEQIAFEGTFIDYKRYGSGHINDTFVTHHRLEDGSVIRYILQRMNHDTFKHPEQLMENVAGVTEFLKRKILQNKGDVKRETMNIIPTKDGKTFYKDSIGSYWRAYRFIEDASCYDMVEKSDDFYQSAIAFGRFQKLLADYPAETLHETIPDFHNTPVRVETLKKAVQEDTLGRVKEVTDEIAFVMEREEFTYTLMKLYKEGKLPLKVTHNDTKLNNIIIDNVTGKAICVIDLDTIMPGFSVNDFGDSIRFGATTGAEDEPDLTKVNFDLSLYELYTRGFLEGCNGSLTAAEIDMLPVGAKMMTLECGIRFLTDYLQGDIYFRIHHEKHNLDRTRTQFKLVSDMEKNWEAMVDVVNKYR